MAIYRIQNTLQDKNGLSRDRYVNTYYVASPTPLTDEFAGLTAVNLAVSNVYRALASFFADCVSGIAHTVKAYDMTIAPGLRDPIAPLTYSIGPTGIGLPNEVAMAVTLEASPVANVQPQSTRGRVFLGPLSASTAPGSVTPGTSARPAAAFRTAILAAYTTLHAEIVAVQPSLRLVVASTVQGKAKLPNGSRQAYEVVAFSVDDAWDTQRSRGNSPTLRERDTITAGTGFSFSW